MVAMSQCNIHNDKHYDVTKQRTEPRTQENAEQDNE